MSQCVPRNQQCDADHEFLGLVERLYEGDPSAAEQIVRDHEPEVRRVVRARLRDPRLRRILDSLDVCQSVFGRFFARARTGAFDLNSPQSLVRLLTRMATNRIVDNYRKDAARRRHLRTKEQEQRSTQSAAFVEANSSPSAAVDYEELLQLARHKLSEKELAISELRNDGLSWLEVSRQLGESPQALRKRFQRARERLTKELHLDHRQFANGETSQH